MVNMETNKNDERSLLRVVKGTIALSLTTMVLGVISPTPKPEIIDTSKGREVRVYTKPFGVIIGVDADRDGNLDYKNTVRPYASINSGKRLPVDEKLQDIYTALLK